MPLESPSAGADCAEQSKKLQRSPRHVTLAFAKALLMRFDFAKDMVLPVNDTLIIQQRGCQYIMPPFQAAIGTLMRCPSGISRQSDLDLNGNIPNKNKEEQKDCDFVSKKCPICKEKNAKTKVRKGVYYHIGKSCKA